MKIRKDILSLPIEVVKAEDLKIGDLIHERPRQRHRGLVVGLEKDEDWLMELEFSENNPSKHKGPQQASFSVFERKLTGYYIVTRGAYEPKRND